MVLFQKTQPTELVVITGRCHEVRSTAFLTEDCFQNLTCIDIENCCVIDGAEFVDITATLPELKILKMRGSNISQYNLVQLSKKARKIEFVDMRKCEPFLFSCAHICIWNFINLEFFAAEMKYPRMENREWRMLLNNFSAKVKFGDNMVTILRFWQRWLRDDPNQNRFLNLFISEE